MEREDEEEDDIGHLAERRGYTDEWVREMAKGRDTKEEEGGRGQTDEWQE